MLNFDRIKWNVAVAVCLLTAAVGWSPSALAAAVESTNLVRNPGFESGMTGWDISGDTSVTSVKSGNAYNGGTYALEYYKGSGFSFTVSQTVYGLSPGKYQLSAMVQGNGGETASELFAADCGGERAGAGYQNSGWSHWQEAAIPVINVTAGKCTIGLHIVSGKELWGVLDNVSLIKTGELDQAPATLQSITPVQVDTIIHTAPVLPSVVTAVYSDTTTKQLPVTWDTVTDSQYGTLGSFDVIGTVAGAAIPVKATVRVTLKPADLNQDQSVNVGDLAIAVYVYGVKNGDANWSFAQAADVNNDGVVDSNDLQFIAQRIRSQ